MNALVTKAIRGTKIPKFSVSPEKGIVGYVYTTQKVILLSPIKNDPLFDPSLDFFKKSTTRNIICVPLKVGKNCIGCLEISNKINGEYSEYDSQLAISISRKLYTGLNLKRNLLTEMKGKDRGERIANDNLLTPLLKNVLFIMAEIMKCEK